MHKLLISLLLSITIIGCKSHSQESESDGSKAVSQCFNSYKSAILDKRGEAAVEELSQETINEYQKYVDWATTADEQEINELSFINRFQALLLRHRVPIEKLNKMDGRSAIVYAIDQNWIGKSSVINTSIGNVNISGDNATTEMLSNGQVSPIYFQFVKEDGNWRFNLISIMQQSSLALKNAVQQSGKSENDFIFELIESVSEKRVTEDIWTPPGRRDK